MDFGRIGFARGHGQGIASAAMAMRLIGGDLVPAEGEEVNGRIPVSWTIEIPKVFDWELAGKLTQNV